MHYPGLNCTIQICEKCPVNIYIIFTMKYDIWVKIHLLYITMFNYTLKLLKLIILNRDKANLFD